MTDEKIFKHTFRVPWSDADPAGIVHYSHFLKYFEFGEIELYRDSGKNLSELMDEFSILLPRVEAHCQFYRPIRWDDLIEVQVRVVKLTQKSVTYQFKLFRQGESDLLTEGSTTIVCVDRERFRATPFPVPLYDLLQARLS